MKPIFMHHRAGLRCIAVGVLGSLLLLICSTASARTLAQVKSLGAISLCANPDALPHSSNKNPDNAGFQIDIAQAIAQDLGVKLNVEWIFPRRRANVVNCDMMLDTINDPPVYEGRLLVSQPYNKTGIALGLRSEAEGVKDFHDLKKGQKVGVMVGSVSNVVLGKRHLTTSPYAFQIDMIEDLIKGELFGAAVSPATLGYYIRQHPEAGLKMLDAYDSEPELSWSVSVGLRKSDQALLDEINRIVSARLADGTIKQIYEKYGIEHRLP